MNSIMKGYGKAYDLFEDYGFYEGKKPSASNDKTKAKFKKPSANTK